MSVSSTHSGFEGMMPGRLRSLVAPPKPDIRIRLNRKANTFTNGDKIDGTVSVTAPFDTSFSNLDIEFLGTSRCYVERLTTAAAVSGRSEAFQQFLKLEQPDVYQHYPEDCLLKAGQTYDFPFVFVIPEHLIPRICRHKVGNSAVHDAHIQLPPTLGDKDLANHPDALDDYAPDMASVRYGVFARLSLSKIVGDDVKCSVLAAKARRVRVMPATDEKPPLDVDGSDEYVLRREKKIKKGVLKGKSGCLVVEAAQPQSLRLANPHLTTEGRTSTMAKVMLRFDPADDKCTPPRLASLNNKLKISTFFASSARHNFPSKQATMYDLSQGVHSEYVPLSQRCVANVEWTKQYPHRPADNPSSQHASNERRDSGTSITTVDLASTPLPSESFGGKAFYVAQILVPIVLPTNKTFVPTFHSCLVSRTYSINMSLGLKDNGIVGGNLDLKIPIQVSQEGGNLSQEALRRASIASSNAGSMQVDLDDHDVDEFFTPRRTTMPPSPEYTPAAPAAPTTHTTNGGNHRREAPPDYTAFASNNSQRTAFRVPVY